MTDVEQREFMFFIRSLSGQNMAAATSTGGGGSSASSGRTKHNIKREFWFVAGNCTGLPLGWLALVVPDEVLPDHVGGTALMSVMSGFGARFGLNFNLDLNDIDGPNTGLHWIDSIGFGLDVGVSEGVYMAWDTTPDNRSRWAGGSYDIGGGYKSYGGSIFVGENVNGLPDKDIIGLGGGVSADLTDLLPPWLPLWNCHAARDNYTKVWP